MMGLMESLQISTLGDLEFPLSTKRYYGMYVCIRYFHVHSFVFIHVNYTNKFKGMDAK